jgi:hypothetical protein
MKETKPARVDQKQSERVRRYQKLFQKGKNSRFGLGKKHSKQHAMP